MFKFQVLTRNFVPDVSVTTNQQTPESKNNLRKSFD